MAEVTVTGEVRTVNGTGNGFTIVEKVTTHKGKTFDRWWRCWMPRQGSYAIPNPGERVTVVGLWAGRIGERGYVDHVLDDIRVQASSPPPPDPDPAPEDAWAPSGWDVAPIPDDVPDEVPF